MNTKRRRIIKLCSLALATILSNGSLTNAHEVPEKEEIIVEASITGFLETVKVKVPIDSKYGMSGGGGQDHQPADVPGSYGYGISVLSRRKNFVILRLNFSLYFNDGTEKQINERIKIVRGKLFEAEYKIGLKIKSYFGTAGKMEQRGETASII
jgi:hypothetical protein